MERMDLEKSFIFGNTEWTDHILGISEMGLWTMVTDRKMSRMKFYIDRTMCGLLGLKENLDPESCFEYWYKRINRGNYAYVNGAIRRTLETGRLCEVQYTWNHPLWGDIPVRCAGRATDLGDGRVLISGYHQNMNVLDQMIRWPLSAGREEIFEYNTSTGTALVCTEQKLIYGERRQFKDFPRCLVEDQIVHPQSAAAFLQAFNVLKEGGKAARCQVKLRNRRGEYSWFSLELEIMAYENDIPGIILGRIEDVSRQKELENICIRERRLNQILLEEFLAYGNVDLTADRTLSLSGRWKEHLTYALNHTYGQAIREVAVRTVKPEHREEFLKTFDREYLMGRYSQEERMVYLEYRRLMEQDRLRWVRMKVYMYADPEEKHVCGFFCLKDMDRLKTMEEQLSVKAGDRGSSAEAGFERLLWSAGDSACLIDPEKYEFITANQAFYRELGKTEEECKGRTCYELIYNGASPCTFCNRLLWDRGHFSLWENVEPDCQTRRMVKTKLVEWEGREALLVVGMDLPPEEKSNFNPQEEREQSTAYKVISGIYAMTEAPTMEESMRRLLDILSDYYEAGHVQMYLKQENGAGCRLVCRMDEYGRQEDNSLLEHDMEEWLSQKRPTGAMDDVQPQDMIGESFEVFKDMERGQISDLSVFPIAGGKEVLGYIAMFDRSNSRTLELLDMLIYFVAQEITRRQDSSRLYYSIYHDALTGLLNRGSYDEYRRQYKADRVVSLGVIVVDINDLRSVNDMRGTEAGDRLICGVADIIKRLFPDYRVFRLNGNEFDIVMEDVSCIEFEQRSGNLLHELAGQDCLPTAVGRVWDDREKNLDWVAKQASELMRIDKQKYYENKPSIKVKGRMDLVKTLLFSLERREFAVYLQPKFFLATGRCAGAEALVRYNNPKYGLVQPSRFIGMLERENLISYVDLYVMEECCRLLEKWKREGRGNTVLSFNFSRMTLLGEDIAESVESIVNKYDVTPRELEIEVTESIGALGRDVVYRALRAFKKKGYRISLDDFGTRYSNLDILSDVEFDVLKLDKSLVDKIGRDKVSLQILKHIIAMCRDLKIQTVAEGVEESRQADYLTQCRCIVGQGYLYGRPMEVEAFEKKFM